MRFGDGALAVLALLIEAAFGYPDWLYRMLGHPVVWIGTGIGWFDRIWNDTAPPALCNRLRGAAMLLILLILVGGFCVSLQILVFRAFPIAMAICLLAALASSLLASRSLDQHVRAVGDAVRSEGLAGGRAAVARIVGRDPGSLDEAAVLRAAIESLAENFSDAVVAPAFWGCVLGLPGMALYKAINTADSMIGHRTPRYRSFGWAAARLDDLVNLPASRLAAFWILLAAFATRGALGSAAIAAVWRDAGRHRSPNAGWPEAAMAGALGLRLAGPRVYCDVRVDDAWMGNGRSAAEAGDLYRALALYRRACAMQIVFLLSLIAVLAWAR